MSPGVDLDKRPNVAPGRAEPGKELVPAVLDAELVPMTPTRRARTVVVQLWCASPVPPEWKQTETAKRAAKGLAVRAALAPIRRYPPAVLRGAALTRRTWWRWVRARQLEESAVADNALHKIVKDLRHDRRVRGGYISAPIITATVVSGAVFVASASTVHVVIVLFVITAVLAIAGKRKDGNPGRKAQLGPRNLSWTLDPDQLTERFLEAGIIKKGERLYLVNRPHRDGDGTAVMIDLPGTRKASDAVKRLEGLASALAVDEVQLILDRVRGKGGHAGRLDMWVADNDPYDRPPTSSPLAHAQTWDLWDDVPWGSVARGTRVTLPVVWTSLLVGAIPRMGKALALDTLVPTPAGWTTMGELDDGDLVFDETGTPCRVVTAHDVRHGRPCFEVEFSDGSVIVADAEHQWQVETRSSRVNRSPAKVMTTSEMRGRVHVEADRRLNFSVRVAAALRCPHDETLPVGPYTLGAWLGDGTCVTGVITNPDPEVIAEIEAEGERVRVLPSTEHHTAPGWRVIGLTARLRDDLGVLGNKHIPMRYLRASADQRRALLAGLLDTDGYCNTGGCVVFAVTSRRLAEDFRDLVATLGYKSGLTSKPARFEGRDYGTAWQVSFTPDRPVFRLARKAERRSLHGKASNRRRFVVDIRPVSAVPVRCITVDSPSSLYLAGGQCIPTHNTFAARLPAAAGALDPHVRLIIFDGKGGKDWRPFAQVAHRYGRGDTPDVVSRLVAVLREAVVDVQRRFDEMADMDDELCPDSKVTPRLTRDPRYRMPLTLIAVDEVQVYLEHEQWGEEILDLLAYLARKAPAAGYSFVLATQKPSADVIKPKLRDNIGTRFALRVKTWQSSEAVLGTGTKVAGYDATRFLRQHLGVGLLLGADGETALSAGEAITTRTDLLTIAEIRAICERGREARLTAGTLTGDAAGDSQLGPVDAAIVASARAEAAALGAGDDGSVVDAELVHPLPTELGAILAYLDGDDRVRVPSAELLDEVVVQELGVEMSETGFGRLLRRWGAPSGRSGASDIRGPRVADLLSAAERIKAGGPVEVEQGPGGNLTVVPEPDGEPGGGFDQREQC